MILRPIINLVVTIVLFSCFVFAQSTGTWKEMNVPKNSAITLIDFADSAYGVLFTQDGKFVTTTNCGVSWSVLASLPNCTKLVNVELINRNLMIVVDELNAGFSLAVRLHITTNLGTTWSDRTLPDSVIIHGGGTVSILSSDVIGFVNGKNIIYRSTDLGTLWDTLHVNPNLFPPNTLHMFSIDNYVIGGGGGLPNSGYLVQSVDSGRTWAFISKGESAVSSNYYTNALGYFRIDYEESGVQRTNTLLYNPKMSAYLTFNDINGYGALYDNGEYLLLGYYSTLVSGNSDSTYYIGPIQAGSVKIDRLTTTSNKYAWILADSGRVFRRIDKITRVGNRTENLLRNVMGHATLNVYPNPFNNTCAIGVTNERVIEGAEIIIYDVLGKKQKMLYEGDLREGTHDFTWDGKNDRSVDVPSGVYFVVLQSLVDRQTTPILLIK